MLVQNDAPITPASMHAALQKLDYNAEIAQCLEQLSSTDFSLWMQKNNHKLKLNSWTILGSQEGNLIPQAKTDEQDLEIIEILGSSKDIPATISELVDGLFSEWFFITSIHPTSHCFCTDRASGHWFLISAIWTEGSIQLWYIDPRNTDYDQYPSAHLFMDYIATRKPRRMLPGKLPKLNWPKSFNIGGAK